MSELSTLAVNQAPGRMLCACIKHAHVIDRATAFLQVNTVGARLHACPPVSSTIRKCSSGKCRCTQSIPHTDHSHMMYALREGRAATFATQTASSNLPEIVNGDMYQHKRKMFETVTLRCWDEVPRIHLHTTQYGSFAWRSFRLYSKSI
jgi:hypothetical protein